MTLLEYILLATSSLFVIVDPIALVPVFLTMTPHDTAAQRLRTARLACVVTAAVLVIFAVFGKWVFNLLGVTMPAFQMAGSIILLVVALDMLQAKRSPVKETTEETDAGKIKEDIAITPLAVPMLAGPGAISTVVLLHNRAVDFPQKLALIVCILGVCVASFLIFALSIKGTRWLSPIMLRLVGRLMGLLLAAIAIQFFLNALKDLKIISF